MRAFFDIPYINNASKEQLLDIYLPDNENFDTVVWFHGGCLESGDRKINYLAAPFTENGMAFVSVEYRMYPDAHFPDFIEDAASSVAYIINNIRTYGGNGNIYVMGESAGAYIAMMLCMDHHYLLDKNIRQEQISGYICDSAQPFCHFNVLRELGIDNRLERIDTHAPIYFIQKDLNIRPLLLLYYSNDIECRPEENLLMYASLKRIIPDVNVTIDKIPGTHCSRSLDESGNLILFKKTYDFIKNQSLK